MSKGLNLPNLLLSDIITQETYVGRGLRYFPLFFKI